MQRKLQPEAGIRVQPGSSYRSLPFIPAEGGCLSFFRKANRRQLENKIFARLNKECAGDIWPELGEQLVPVEPLKDPKAALCQRLQEGM